MDEKIIYYDDIEQNSKEWFDVKAGVPSASESRYLLAGVKGFKTYTLKKFAQLYSRQSETYVSAAMERGNDLEPDARIEYENQFLVKVNTVGFVKNFTKKCGCSPDGIVHNNITGDYGLEIKCFNPERHMEFYLTGEPHKEVYEQVQFSMYVTGLKKWVIAYYNPDFQDDMKLITLEVKPNGVFFKRFETALNTYYEVFQRYHILKLKSDGKNKFLSRAN